MTRVRTVLASAALALALIPAMATASPISTMIAKVNGFRQAHGLSVLTPSGALDGSAGRYAGFMMSTGYFGHLNRIQASHHYRTLGEIIEIHTGRTAAIAGTFADWLRSPPHRAVLLYPNFRYVGAGFTTGSFRGRAATIWCVHFGR